MYKSRSPQPARLFCTAALRVQRHCPLDKSKPVTLLNTIHLYHSRHPPRPEAEVKESRFSIRMLYSFILCTQRSCNQQSERAGKTAGKFPGPLFRRQHSLLPWSENASLCIRQVDWSPRAMRTRHGLGHCFSARADFSPKGHLALSGDGGVVTVGEPLLTPSG